ncbi:MAG: phenylalanine--tRNA ligase subunit beta [Fimbriimonadaceae bacterium]
MNGDEHELRDDQMMVCDAERPVGVAGVMGGLATEVTDSTKRVLLESAHFLNTSVRRTRKQMGLNTEASYRFERSVDPEGVVRALHRFAELHEQITGIGAGPVEDVYPRPPKLATIRLRMDRARTLLGLDFSDDQAIGYLSRLGFDLDAGTVTAPTWRPDVVAEEDVIEEIGRVHGFDKIPEALPPGSARGGQSAIEQAIEDIRHKVMACGFVQCISHTLRDEHPLDGTGKRTGPRNPGSPDHAILRNSTLPSLADAARRNGGRDLHLFETGRVFGETERRMIGLLSHGLLFPLNRAKDPIPCADFFSLKGVLESLAPGLVFKNGDDPRLHPTRQARISDFGIIGEIHPNIADEIGLPVGTVLAELCLDSLAQASITDIQYHAISRNPSVRRDIAFIVEKSTSFQSLEQAIKSACGEALEDHWLFDVYDGTGIPDGKHSLAVAIQLRKHGENFTDEEANQVREQAVSALEALGATVRK